jgi:hypothetical protein
MEPNPPTLEADALAELWQAIQTIQQQLSMPPLPSRPSDWNSARSLRVGRIAYRVIQKKRNAAIPQVTILGGLPALWAAVQVVHSGGNSYAPGYNPGAGLTSLKASLGANIQGLVSYTTQIPFLNMFPQSRIWEGRRPIPHDGWIEWVSDSRPIYLDIDGWVKQLEPDQYAETVVFDGHIYYPAGEWVITWEGTGSVTCNHSTVNSSSNRLIINVAPNTQGIVIRIGDYNQSNSGTYIKNIRLIQPGKESSFLAGQIFDPTFLSILSTVGIKTLRLMDLMGTNDDRVRVNANQLPTLSTAQWTPIPPDSKVIPDANRFGSPLPADPQYWQAPLLNRGMPIAVQIELCNTLNTNAWINIPIKLNDAAVQAIAIQWRDDFNPNKLIYIELSNEVWNWQFWQTRHAYQQGQAMGLSADENHFWYAKRSVEVFQIFEQVFAERTRIRRVLSTQGAVPYVGGQILNYQHSSWSHPAKYYCDYCAAALYFSGSHQWINKPFNAEYILSLSNNAIIDWMYEDVTVIRTEGPGGIHDPEYAQPSNRKMIADHAALCSANGVKPAMYEGGPHLMASQFPSQYQEAITAKYIAINQHPRMADVVTAYLRTLDYYDIEPACWFAFTSSRWDKFGMWTALEYQGQSLATAYKAQAIRAFIAS